MEIMREDETKAGPALIGMPDGLRRAGFHPRAQRRRAAGTASGAIAPQSGRASPVPLRGVMETPENGFSIR